MKETKEQEQCDWDSCQFCLILTIFKDFGLVSREIMCEHSVNIFRSARTSYRTFGSRPSVRPSVRPSRPQEKFRSPLQPYKSSQDHCQPIKREKGKKGKREKEKKRKGEKREKEKMRKEKRRKEKKGKRRKSEKV